MKTRNLLTNPGLVKLDRESSDQIFQERPDQPEVDAADTPGAIHKNNNVRYGWSLTHKSVFSWRQTDKNKESLTEKWCWAKFPALVVKMTLY